MNMQTNFLSRHAISSKTCLIAFAMLGASALAGGAQAQSLPSAAQPGCYNIVPAQPGAQPAILIDRCSGQTWQLLSRYGGGSARRRSHVVYVWSPIGQSETQVERTAPLRPAPAPAARGDAPASAAHGNAKCFQFNGRTFCE